MTSPLIRPYKSTGWFPAPLQFVDVADHRWESVLSLSPSISCFLPLVAHTVPPLPSSHSYRLECKERILRPNGQKIYPLCCTTTKNLGMIQWKHFRIDYIKTQSDAWRAEKSWESYFCVTQHFLSKQQPHFLLIVYPHLIACSHLWLWYWRLSVGAVDLQSKLCFHDNVSSENASLLHFNSMKVWLFEKLVLGERSRIHPSNGVIVCMEARSIQTTCCLDFWAFCWNNYVH